MTTKKKKKLAKRLKKPSRIEVLEGRFEDLAETADMLDNREKKTATRLSIFENQYAREQKNAAHALNMHDLIQYLVIAFLVFTALTKSA